MFQGQTHFNDLHAELIVEVTDTEHLRPKPFTSCGEKKDGLFISCDYKLLLITHIFKVLLTCERVDSDGGAHLLKLNSELWVLSDFLFVFAGKLLQVGLERIQLFGHLGGKHIIPSIKQNCSGKYI